MKIHYRTVQKIVIFLIFFVIGFGIGNRYGNYRFNLALKNYIPQLKIQNEMPPENVSIDMTDFWRVWSEINAKYVDRMSLDKQKMLNGAIQGLVASLDDPYTAYLTPADNEASKDDLKGSFEGIGAQLGLDGKKVVVIAPLEGTPAEKIGILAGDHIYEVNGETLDGKSLPYAVSKIRGPKGTIVKLTIKRKNEKNNLTFNIQRGTIVVKSVSVSFKQKEGKSIAVIKLSKFGDQTEKEWQNAIIEVKGHQSSGVILDLRNNPGGYLSGAVFVASEFLPAGKVVVTQASGYGEDVKYRVERQGQLRDLPLIVLINKGSASASEIVAGALRDYNRAKLIGEKTFGKGSVQEAEDFESGAGLHLTVAKWITPNGSWIHKVGITPDEEVKNDPKNPKQDKQLDYALKII